MKKIVGKVLKIIGGCLVGFIILTIAIGLMYQGDDNKPATSKEAVSQKPVETEIDETEEKEEVKSKETTESKPVEDDKKESKRESEIDEALEWLTSIGAFETLSKDWGSDEEVLNLYNSIYDDMKSWDTSFDDMRDYLEGFDPNLTIDEIAALTDYQVYINYKNLKESIVADGEEPDWEDDYTYNTLSVQQFKDFIRDDANIGNTVTFKGVVFSTNMSKYNYAINIDPGLLCYISDPGFNLLINDEVKITAIYRGKNNTGLICFDTISVEIQ